MMFRATLRRRGDERQRVTTVAAFKATVWRTAPWTRLAAVLVLGLLGAVATSLSVVALSAAAVVVLATAADRLPARAARQHPSAPASGAL